MTNLSPKKKKKKKKNDPWVNGSAVLIKWILAGKGAI